MSEYKILGYKEKPKKKRRLWDNYMEIGEIVKSETLKIRVAAAYRDGVGYVSLREFYLNKGDDNWYPARHGLVVPVMVPIHNGTERITPYGDMTALMGQAIDMLRVMPLADPNNAVWLDKRW